MHNETICYELVLSKRKWSILCSYRPPSTPDKTFDEEMSTVLDKMYINFDHVIVYGDLNYNMLKNDKRKPIDSLIDYFNLTNLINEPTCFPKNSTPSLIDLILTNSSNLLCNTKVVNCSISDCHCMILTTIKEQVNFIERKHVHFRSYKHFDETVFENDLAKVPFHVAHIFEDIDDIYWANEVFFKQVVDEHAHLKQKKPRKNPPPYMNSEYRKIIYKTRQAHNTYLKNRTNKNWNLYKTLRNKKSKIMRSSIKIYFMERCSEGPKSKDFWPTIKPFLSKNSQCKNTNTVILKEDDTLSSDQSKVCETLNDFYVNIANNISINNSTPVDK